MLNLGFEHVWVSSITSNLTSWVKPTLHIIPLISNNMGQSHFKIYHPTILRHGSHRDMLVST
jgi:hypothetical protein